MNVFISGGCKNGKSFLAQKEAKRQARQAKVPLYYVATMIPKDDEDHLRIKRHIEERAGWGFETLEQGKCICDILHRADPAGVFLLDSVTALLSNEMFDREGNVSLKAPEKVKNDLVAFAEQTGNTVFVSDYIYSDAFQYDTMTETYRKGLASIDKALAHCCERVVEVTYGYQYDYKGGRK